MTRTGRGAALLLLTLLCPRTVNAQGFVSIFDGSSLSGWRAEHRDADVKDGVLTLTRGAGWVRTQRVYADFNLKLDVRAEKEAVVSVFVRAWPTFGPDGTPSNGHLIRMRGQKNVTASDAWQHLEIEAVGNVVTVRADGQVVYTSPKLENPQGHIGLAVSDQSAQFRNIEIQQRRPPSLKPSDTGARDVGKGVLSPKVIERTQPRYTPDAMRARITGTVIISGVVTTEGTVADLQLLQSLDPHFGLDRAAMEVASQWRFEPGRLGVSGEPVPVRVVIELEFNLK